MMTRTMILLLAALLFVPVIDAAAPAGAVVDKQTDTVKQVTTTTNHISEKIEFRVTVTSQYNGNWSFDIQPGHQNLQAFAIRNGDEQNVNVSVVKDGSGHDTAYVNLSALHKAIATSDTFSIRFEYDVGPTYDRIVTSEPAQLVVYAEPIEDQIPVGENLPNFFPTSDRYHAVDEDVADGHHYTVKFVTVQTTGGGATRDMTPYLYALVGVVAGFLIALMLARRGMIAQKEKKFVKGGAMESRDMLTARRRTLMAALKELELAHEAKEIPDNAYAPLKEEYKAQTVRVMRNLEEKNEPGR